MKTYICKVCQNCLPLEKFEWQKNRPNPRKVCKLCRSRNRKYSSEQKDKLKLYRKEYRLSGKAQSVFEKHKYGISKKEIFYKHCAICKSTKRLHIDHCHNTNKFRALLCSKCNTGLGMFDENIDKLFKAILYLNHFNKNGESFRDAPHWEL